MPSASSGTRPGTRVSHDNPIRLPTHLASGANNDITLLEFPDRRVVVKQVRASAPDRIATERRVLSHLAEGIAPKVLDGILIEDADDRPCLVLEHIEGEHRHRLDIPSAELLGKALASFHAADTGPFAGFLEQPTWRDYFRDRLVPQLEDSRDAAPSVQVRNMERCLERIRDLGQELDEGMVSAPRVLVHTDIIPLNTIFQAECCRVIDWELARIDLPEWDLASAIKSFVFAPGAREAMLEAYGAPMDSDRLRFVALLHHANVALWRMCSFYRRGENQSIRATFLRELEEEIAWIQEHLS